MTPPRSHWPCALPAAHYASCTRTSCFALAIKFACLVLGAIGMASMWTAIFADVGVMVLAVLNATRALYTKDLAKKNEP